MLDLLVIMPLYIKILLFNDKLFLSVKCRNLIVGRLHTFTLFWYMLTYVIHVHSRYSTLSWVSKLRRLYTYNGLAQITSNRYKYCLEMKRRQYTRRSARARCCTGR